MFRRASKPLGSPLPDAPRTMEGLMAIAARWGIETGFLALPDLIDARLTALVEEEAARKFGACEADRERRSIELETLEAEWLEAKQIESAYRLRYGSTGTLGLVDRIRAWLWDFRKLGNARVQIRRKGSELHRKREEFDASELSLRAARQWRESTTLALQAHYQYHKLRAASARLTNESDKERFNENTEHNYRNIGRTVLSHGR